MSISGVDGDCDQRHGAREDEEHEDTLADLVAQYRQSHPAEPVMFSPERGTIDSRAELHFTRSALMRCQDVSFLTLDTDVRSDNDTPGRRPSSLSVVSEVTDKTDPAPARDATLSYGAGWERTVGICPSTRNFVSRWRRPDGEGPLASSDCLDFAYSRKVETLGAEGESVRSGRVSLVAPDDVVYCGQAEVTVGDVEEAHKISGADRIEWLRGQCDKLREGEARIAVRRKRPLEGSMKAIMSFNQEHLRRTWVIELERESGELPLWEWYESVFEQVFSPDAGLWKKCRADGGCVEINCLSESECPDHLEYFRFIGRVMGKALLDRQPVAHRLSKHLYKLLLGWPLQFDDLRDLDPRYHRFLKSLTEIGADVEKLGLTFAVPEHSGGSKRASLILNGCNVAVEEEDLPEYIDACFKHRAFGRYKSQVSELVLGFLDVVPEPLLTAFDPWEFERLLCGAGETEGDALGDDGGEEASGGGEDHCDRWRSVLREYQSLSEDAPDDGPSATEVEDRAASAEERHEARLQASFGDDRQVRIDPRADFSERGRNGRGLRRLTRDEDVISAKSVAKLDRRSEARQRSYGARNVFSLGDVDDIDEGRADAGDKDERRKYDKDEGRMSRKSWWRLHSSPS